MAIANIMFSGCKGGAGKTAAVLLKVEKVSCKVGTTVCGFIQSWCAARGQGATVPLNDAMNAAVKAKK